MPKQTKQNKEKIVLTQEQEMQIDLKKAKALDAMADSEGGGILINALVTEIVSNIDALTVAYKATSHAEIIAIIAGLKARLDLLRILGRAKDAKDTMIKLVADALIE